MIAATRPRRRVRQVRRVGPAGQPPLRAQEVWERIECPGGTYVARRAPRVQLLLVDAASFSSFAGGVLVLDTHQLALAAELAWPVWARHQPGRRLSAPTVGWWRQAPAVEVAGLDRRGGDVDSLWWPVPAGIPGAVPGVEFPFPTPDRPGRARERGGRR